MPVTSNCLFHFTSSLEKLQGILKNKFLLTYCHENYWLNNALHEDYYPMVSFCDIPLSQAEDQIMKYGKFAIGMDKDWGIKHQLNPVIYISRESLMAGDLISTVSQILKAMSLLFPRLRKQVPQL